MISMLFTTKAAFISILENIVRIIMLVFFPTNTAKSTNINAL